MGNEEPTVFVVPPNNSLLCPLHFGVMEDPVDVPCGCTFCRSCISQVLSSRPECPLHGCPLSADQFRSNEYAKVFVNDLLIHCKGGLQKSSNGEWVPRPTGCKLWIRLGMRKEHEEHCVHVKKQNVDRPVPPVLICTYHELGCLFTGQSEQEARLHAQLCGYGRLLQHINQLQAQIAQKDSEIARLNSLLTEQENTIRVSLPNIPNVLESISQGLEKLDEDSTRLFEDAKNSLQKTKTAVRNSPAVQNSLQVINHIKEVVESARSEFVAKLAELERIAKYKLHSLRGGGVSIAAPPNITYYDYNADATTNSNNNNNDNDNNNNNNNNNDTNNNNSNTDNTKTDDGKGSSNNTNGNVTETAGNNTDNNNNNNTESNTNSTTTNENKPAESENTNETNANAETPQPAVNNNPLSSSTDQLNEDEEIKALLEESKREYLNYQARRMAEEESIRQAMRLSLLDLMGNSQN